CVEVWIVFFDAGEEMLQRLSGAHLAFANEPGAYVSFGSDSVIRRCRLRDVAAAILARPQNRTRVPNFPLGHLFLRRHRFPAWHPPSLGRKLANIFANELRGTRQNGLVRRDGEERVLGPKTLTR